MKWYFDDGPLGHLARVFNPNWSSPPSALFVVDVVAGAAGQDRSGRRQQLLGMTSGGHPCIEVVSIPAGSDVERMVFTYLRPQYTHATRDLGEDATIAHLALGDQDGVFVTCDKGAGYLAICELGPGRVASPFDVWTWLADERLISEAERMVLNEAILKGDRSLPGGTFSAVKWLRRPRSDAHASGCAGGTRVASVATV